MPRKKLDFPGRRQRRQLLDQLRELERAEGKEFTDNELYQQYQKALAALDDRMEELSETDERGLPKPLTDETRQELQNLMITAATAGETFLAKMQEQKVSLTKSVPGMVNTLQGLMASDYDAVSSYDPKTGQSLPEIQEKARTRTVVFQGEKLSKMGNMQSSRIPITLTNGRDRTRKGVFTKANYNTTTSDFHKVIDDAKALCDDAGKAELDKLMDNFREVLKYANATKRDGSLIGDETTEDYLIGYFGKMLRNQYKGKEDEKLSVSEISQFLKKYCMMDMSKISSQAKRSLLPDSVTRERSEEISTTGILNLLMATGSTTAIQP